MRTNCALVAVISLVGCADEVGGDASGGGGGAPVARFRFSIGP
jgi:hypothetical protein